MCIVVSDWLWGFGFQDESDWLRFLVSRCGWVGSDVFLVSRFFGFKVWGEGFRARANWKLLGDGRLNRFRKGKGKGKRDRGTEGQRGREMGRYGGIVRETEREAKGKEEIQKWERQHLNLDHGCPKCILEV